MSLHRERERERAIILRWYHVLFGGTNGAVLNLELVQRAAMTLPETGGFAIAKIDDEPVTSELALTPPPRRQMKIGFPLTDSSAYTTDNTLHYYCENTPSR